MKKDVLNEIEATLNATTEAVWDLLKTGADVHKWFPILATCDLQGQGVGAKRVCTTEDGMTLKETIVKLDDDNRIIGYNIDSHTMPMPTTNLRGVMQVTDNGGQARLNWKVTFDLTQELEEEALSEMQNGMKDMMRTGFDGLEKLASKTS